METLNNNVEKKEEIKPIVAEGLKQEILNNPSPEERLEKQTATTEKVGFIKRQLNKIAEKKAEKALEKGELRIQLNPKMKAMFAQLEQTNPEKAHKLQIALGKWEYVKWDENKKDFVDSGTYTEFVNK